MMAGFTNKFHYYSFDILIDVHYQPIDEKKAWLIDKKTTLKESSQNINLQIYCKSRIHNGAKVNDYDGVGSSDGGTEDDF